MTYALETNRRVDAGFTFIELIVVVVIIGIAALLSVPMFSAAGDVQMRAAASMIASDLEYAKNMAITHQRNYSVVFDPATERYEIRRYEADGTWAVIKHPTNPTADFRVDLAADDRTSAVDIVSVNFDGSASNAVTFDYLGGPHSGLPGAMNPLNNGQVSLSADGFGCVVTIEPVTGYVSIQ